MTSLERLQEKTRGPVRRHKRTTAAAWQWIRNSGTPSKSGLRQSKKRSFPGAEVAPLEPLEEKTRGPVRRHKRTQRQPLGNGSETAEHHLNPGSGKAKNDHSPGAEVAPLEPLKEKKKAPVVSKKRDAT